MNNNLDDESPADSDTERYGKTIDRREIVWLLTSWESPIVFLVLMISCFVFLSTVISPAILAGVESVRQQVEAAVKAQETSTEIKKTVEDR